ncbi:MAG: hypothetical protein ACQUHE_15870, partial [Bacteroidia bacterium]
MKHVYARIVCLFLISLTFFGRNAFAEGSKDLYPSGATGNRAFLMSYTASMGTGNASWPYKGYGVHYVYAISGERLALASSTQGYGTGQIIITDPNGNVTQTTLGVSTTGRISNRTQELAGPLAPSEAANGNKYAPHSVSVTTSGVWKIEFVGAVNSGVTTGTFTTTATDISADASWTQTTSGSGGIYIAAWDVSVRNAANSAWVNGRVYTNILNL